MEGKRGIHTRACKSTRGMHGNTSIQLLEIAMGSSHLQVLSGVYGEGAQIEKYQLG